MLAKVALAFFISAQNLPSMPIPVAPGVTKTEIGKDVGLNNEFAVIALNRIFHPKVMEIADWVVANKAGISTPKQYFTTVPIFYKEEGKSAWFVISPDKVMQVSLIQDPQALASGVLGNFGSSTVYWNILPKAKSTSSDISFDTEKALRTIIRGAIFELMDAKGSAVQNRDVDALTEVIEKAVPTVITQVETAVDLDPEWLRNLVAKLVDKANRKQLNPQLGSMGVGKLALDQTKNIVL